MNEEFAGKLKEKRKSLDFTVEEVVEKTKIAPSVVKALEDAHWEQISPAYLKGFLKIYSSFLGLPFDNAVLETSSLTEDPAPEHPVKKRHRYPKTRGNINTSPERRVSRPKTDDNSLSGKSKLPFPPIRAIIAVCFCVFILVMIKACFERKTSVSNTSHPQENIITPPAAAPSKPVKFETSRKKILPENELEVTLTIKKDCFVKVRVERNVVFEGVLKKGIVETWSAQKVVELKISDGTAVDVEVNGKLLPALTRSRRPIKSLRITPSGITVSK